MKIIDLKVIQNILKITAVNGICKVKWQTIRTGKNSVMDMVLCLREKDIDGFEKVVKYALFGQKLHWVFNFSILLQSGIKSIIFPNFFI